MGASPRQCVVAVLPARGGAEADQAHGDEAGGGTSYRFTGFVRDWPVRWPTGGQEYAVVEVSAFDRLEMLGREDVRSPLSEELLRDDPVCYYPLTEPTGSTSAGDISPNRQPALSTLAFGSGRNCRSVRALARRPTHPRDDVPPNRERVGLPDVRRAVACRVAGDADRRNEWVHGARRGAGRADRRRREPQRPSSGTSSGPSWARAR